MNQNEKSVALLKLVQIEDFKNGNFSLLRGGVQDQNLVVKTVADQKLRVFGVPVKVSDPLYMIMTLASNARPGEIMIAIYMMIRDHGRIKTGDELVLTLTDFFNLIGEEDIPDADFFESLYELQKYHGSDAIDYQDLWLSVMEVGKERYPQADLQELIDNLDKVIDRRRKPKKVPKPKEEKEAE